MLLNSDTVIKKLVAHPTEPKGELRHRHCEQFPKAEEHVSCGAGAGTGLPGAHCPLDTASPGDGQRAELLRSLFRCTVPLPCFAQFVFVAK